MSEFTRGYIDYSKKILFSTCESRQWQAGWALAKEHADQEKMNQEIYSQNVTEAECVFD